MESKQSQTFIFIGRSGCGKGTQAKLLIEKLEQSGIVSEDKPMFYIQTGDKFREFVSRTSHSSRLAKDIMEQAERQPDFLAIWMWSDLLITNLMGGENIVFDGAPRSLNEAMVLDTAIKFFNRQDVKVVYLDVSNEWSKTRLLERGRKDDQKLEYIERRLSWFETDVLPAVEYYEGSPDYQFIRVNGEQTVE